MPEVHFCEENLTAARQLSNNIFVLYHLGNFSFRLCNYKIVTAEVR